MKALKKLSCVLLAVLLLMSLTVTAFAEDGAPTTFKVTIDEKLAGHEFTAYQIFKGSQNAESGNALGAVDWGDGIDAAAFVKALNGLGAPFGACDVKDPNTVVKALNEVGDDSEMAKKVAEAAIDHVSGSGTAISAGSNELPNGYYLIKDTTPAGELNGNAAYNDVVLQVTTDVTVKYKTDVPKSEKKVKDIDDTHSGEETDWQDSADWDIGDKVPFQITGTLPSNYGDYDSYAITFHDTQSAGLTFNAESVAVKVGETDITSAVTVTTTTGDDCTFHVVIENLKDVASDAKAGDQVIITYNSTLNENAVIGKTGNPNEMTMEFSNNPHGEGTGKTEKDKVVVFTYEFNANKVDKEGKALEGAGFTLYKKDTKVGTDITLFEDTSYETKYEGVKEVGKYEVKEGQTSFDFKGLDDGDYILVETTVPDGYNKADDIEFSITATHEDDVADPKLLTFTATGDEINVNEPSASGTEVQGKIDINVVNEQGLTLPETGGIGTTIFYTVGGILVAAALVLLITKKRMSKEG